jgi:hypothetical protein
MAVRSKARTVFGGSNTGVAASNPVWGMDVRAFFCVVLFCVGTGLASADPPYKEYYRTSLDS